VFKNIVEEKFTPLLFYSLMNKFPDHFILHLNRINLDRAEEEALQDLLSDQSIVIRPCDKGSGVCVINTEDYVHS
jgi:hypothetical protein